MATISTINVGGIDKEIEDSVARSNSEYASNKVDRLDSDVAGLHTQVDQIIAPSGEAPNPSEITDARIGINGITYNSLGASVRGQFQEVLTSLKKSIQKAEVEGGASSTTSISFLLFPTNPNTPIKVYNASSGGIGVSVYSKEINSDDYYIETLGSIPSDKEQTLTPVTGGDYLRVFFSAGAIGTVYIEYSNSDSLRLDALEKNTSHLDDIVATSIFPINLLDEPLSIQERYRVNPNTGAVEYGYNDFSVYTVNVISGKTYHITRTSDVIKMIWVYNSNDEPISSLYDLGLTNWNSDFTVPGGAVKLRVTISNDYRSTAFIGQNYDEWSNGKKYLVGNGIMTDFEFAFKAINLLDRPNKVLDSYRVNPHTGEVEYGYGPGDWKVYEIDIVEGKTYHITRTSDVIMMIWLYDADDNPINSLYNLGLTNWNSDFTVPSGATKLKTTVTANYRSTAFIGQNYNEWSNGKSFIVSDSVLINHENGYVTIGAGGDFATIKEGFAYAVNNDLGAIILPGVYDLVAEGVTGIGVVAPKHVKGYGAKLLLNLSSENWDISGINLSPNMPEVTIEGVEIEVTNGRYCLHDEMYSYPGEYHHVIKNCKFKHNSSPSEILIAPRAIGGGIGNSGVVEIYNCDIDSKVNYGDLAYHSNGLGSQSGNVYMHIHDNYIHHAVQFSRSGTDTSYMNIAYVSNNRFGSSLPSDGVDYNMKTIAWNNDLITE